MVARPGSTSLSFQLLGKLRQVDRKFKASLDNLCSVLEGIRGWDGSGGELA